MGTVEIGKEIISIARKLTVAERGIKFAPEMEVDLASLAPNVDIRELLFITSDSVIHAGHLVKIGMACGIEHFYYCNRPKHACSFSLSDVESVSFSGRNRMGSYSPGDKITVVLKSGERHILAECMIGCDCSVIIKIIERLARYDLPINHRSEVRTVSLDELSMQQQIHYMEVLYNYAYLSGCEVDSSEYVALQSIITRIGLPADARNELRDYLFLLETDTNSRTKSGALIRRAKNEMSYGSYEVFRHSLMQDALYLRVSAQMPGAWYEDHFLNGLQKVLEISDEQIECMLSAIQLYRKMQAKDSDLGELNKMTESLLAHAHALRIPREAVFCSGSVYNIDTYRGFFRKSRQKKSITLQRELLLQEVIRNSQISQNHLIEDMNDLTVKLVKEVRMGNQLNQTIQELMQFQRQMMAFKKQSEEVEQTRIYNRLPQTISFEEINQIVLPKRDVIKQCYVADSTGVYRIRNNLIYEELIELSRIEELSNDEDY